MAIRTEPRVAPGVRPAAVQVLALLALANDGVAAQLAVAAAENPALRLIPPAGQWSALSLHDPDGVAAPEGGLLAHVLREIGLLRLSPRAAAVARLLAGALEPTGWLSEPPARLAAGWGLPPAEVEAVLAQLTAIDPPGLFARDLAGCLRAQAQAEGQLDAAMTAVLEDLPRLAAGDAAGIAAAAGLDPGAVLAAVRRLRGYDPKPGLRFAGPVPVLPPDLRIALRDGRWQAELHPAAPRAELAPAGGDRRAARRMLAAVARRNAGILSVAEVLAAGQGAFLSGGTDVPAALTSAMVAAQTGLSRATVNRILSGLTAETPRGTLRLRALTARPVRDGGPAAAAVRARLAALLRGPAQSDAALARLLAAEGLPVARRTVAKYRAGLALG